VCVCVRVYVCMGVGVCVLFINSSIYINTIVLDTFPLV